MHIRRSQCISLIEIHKSHSAILITDGNENECKQSLGKKAEMIPWDKIEEKYAELFPSKTGMPARPLRMALGSLLIQKQYDYSDEELVEQLRENQ